MRAMLTPKIWAIFRPLVERAKRSAAGAKPKLTDLMFLEALLFLIRTGLPWRDLPSRFGDWNAVYQRFKRWRENNVFQRLFEDMPKDTPLENIKRIFIDSSVVRAHQHAAGAAKTGDDDDQDLGRSRGGLSTKIHVACLDENTLIAVEVTPGQAGDAPEFDNLFDESIIQVPDIEEVVADKAYDSDSIRSKVIEEGDIPVHIPNKTNAKEEWPIDKEAYKSRNKIERFFNKLKQFRRIATRYDKLSDCFLSFIHLAATFIKCRSFVNRT